MSRRARTRQLFKDARFSTGAESGQRLRGIRGNHHAHAVIDGILPVASFSKYVLGLFLSVELVLRNTCDESAFNTRTQRTV